MNRKHSIRGYAVALLLTALSGIFPGIAAATILGVTGPTFDLYAKADNITTGDGDSMYMWGYAFGSGARMQYPGPTMIVNQNDTVTINLYNQLPVPVSIVFPGQTMGSVTGGVQGLLTREVPAVPTHGSTTGPVTYTFTASQPGTYIYYSGTRPDLEVEMGMVGTIIVRPDGFDAMSPKQAYGDPSTAYEREYLFLLTEADPLIHQKAAFATGTIAQIQAQLARIDTTTRHPVDWFLNGRNLPDTMADASPATDGLLPTQPYNCLPMAHPGERVLMRMVSAGADLHPFHTHGQNHLIIAREGRLLKTGASDSPDLAVSDYTTTSIPGETVDAIWGPWTGAMLGWDAYGPAAGFPVLGIPPHTCTPDGTGFDPTTHEWCADHDKPIPVTLPAESNITYGPLAFYGGTPYLGVPADKAPSNPGLPDVNTVGAYTFMWHSHSERELTTNDIFIGGMGTMMMILPLSYTINP